ncbi:Wnt-binding factor-like protein [Sarcoptes scabiei]|uniref:Wnt-binding factor-like protein n=1 Tax=Sarcoptes scabiei TaxID=52283 RepID=A0A131ZUK7_SARSC|nr:Wnt-binding factor-like protein [Sarcoptes scabiei]
MDFKSLFESNSCLNVANGHLRSTLFCAGRKCQPIRALHLIKIEFQHYRINLTFNRLESVNEKYSIEDIQFEFRSVNVSFTNLSIWFRFFFLMITFIVLCFYMNHLYRFPLIDWSMEQKWTAAQLIILILSNNPFYPIQFLLGSHFPYLLEIWLHTTLQTMIMFFWLCFFHGIRRVNRPVSRFYAGKVLIVGTIWLSVSLTMSWSLKNQISNPIFDEINAYKHSAFLQFLQLSFYISFVLYFCYLIILTIAAFTELHSLPYFDVRLKLQTFLMIFVITISILTILLSSYDNEESNLISLIPFLKLLPFTHFASSSATFLSIFSLTNIYICCCAYYYRPSLNRSNEFQIIRDNPTLSMINDSDEEILYGSDTDELLRIQQRTDCHYPDQNYHHETPPPTTTFSK